MSINQDFGERFVRLGLTIDEHQPGYVDAFFGPEEWRVQAKQQGKIPLSDLMAQVSELTSDLSTTDDMDSQRKEYLDRHLIAMQMTLRLLSGEKVSLAEEAQALYDIYPQWKDESNFEEAYKILDDALPAGDSLNERKLAWEQSLEISTEKAKELLPAVINRLRALTRKKFDLPDGEDFTVEFVSNQPWSAYNWYLGNAKSRIEINTDLPMRIYDLPALIAHEAYPGHHTDLCIKEVKLVKGLKYYEFTINLLNAPSAVMAEGIATTALKTILPDYELERWFRDELLLSAGMSHIDPQRILALRNVPDKISGLSGNAAFMLLDQKKSEEEVSQYFQRYGPMSEKEAKHMVRFISAPLNGSYVFTYDTGHDMLEKLFQLGGRDHYVRRVIEEPVTPSLVRQWIENSN